MGEYYFDMQQVVKHSPWIEGIDGIIKNLIYSAGNHTAQTYRCTICEEFVVRCEHEPRHSFVFNIYWRKHTCQEDKSC